MAGASWGRGAGEAGAGWVGVLRTLRGCEEEERGSLEAGGLFILGLGDIIALL